MRQSIDVAFAPYQFLAINNPYFIFFMFGGFGVGKSFSGAHFAIERIRQRPDQTGFIGANTYDQLSKATLREFFFWLSFYGFEYVVDQRPPRAWRARELPKEFKSYENIISVRYLGEVVTIFSRVVSDENPFRGIEVSWFWIDESRDMKKMAFDVLVSRMRESEGEPGAMKGLLTTTTNGEDWSYEIGVKSNTGDLMFGSMHVPTSEAVRLGLRPASYEKMLRRTLSPNMALQELDALHVNVAGGRAYYSAGAWNKCAVAPWGDSVPNPSRPLILGCDFNFQPAPCVWVVGQLGPPIHGPRGQFWGNHIHWFGEIADTNVSSREMARTLIRRYPGYHYSIYGDSSGNRGTTSNAGETDYKQMADEFIAANCVYSLDVDQANPFVKDRIEAMNAKLKNAVGEVTMTYNPNTCPLLDGDLRVVGWKKVVLNGNGKLDSGGSEMRTHASDGAGYAVYKLFPATGVVRHHVGASTPDPNLVAISHVFGG